MIVYNHFAVETLSNTYLVGLEHRKAMLVDPGVFDGELLELIEHHSYEIAAVLLTHASNEHLGGLRTLSRIYQDIRVCSAMPEVLDLKAEPVLPGSRLELCGYDVEVIGLPGQGRDCLAFRLEGFLFCGTALSAGELGSVPNSYARAILMDSVADLILTLPAHTVILPFFGPPTTVGIERLTLPIDDARELSEQQ